MRDRNVSIITGSRILRRTIQRGIASLGCQIHTCDMVRSEITSALAEDRHMYILDADGDSETVLWTIDKLYVEHPDSILLMVSGGQSDSSFLQELLMNRGINNLIAKHGGVASNAINVDESELMITCYKLLKPDVFGIEKYLNTLGILISEHTVRGTEDKNRALVEIEEFLIDVDCHRQMIPLISTVADEMLMNAVFDAPRNELGEAKYGGIDRMQPLVLAPGEEVRLQFACDGKHVALAVGDQFGALDRDVVIRYLSPALMGEKAAIEYKEGGAGLGLHLMFQSISQLIFNIQPNVRTESIALFYVREGIKALRTAGHSLNIFMVNSDA